MFRSAQHDSTSFRNRVLKQLEFLVVGQALHLPKVVAASLCEAKRHSGSERVPEGRGYSDRDYALESQARELLRQLGAGKLAREVRVEWNPRLKSAAGRADFREKLISLNPLLLELGARLAGTELGTGKLDCLKQSSPTSTVASIPRGSEKLDGLKPSSLGRDCVTVFDEIDRTLRHELAHLLAQFRVGRRRIAPHGPEWRDACRDLGIADEARCHNLPFATKVYLARFVYRCPNCRQEFPRVRRIRRAIACLACCRKHNRGNFDPRFRLKLTTQL
jgi:predicted SprT family Zn-dependent metalloprotease